MHILLADDDSNYREFATRLFAKWPEHQLTLAEDGREAWTLLDDPKRWFDVVLLDVNMPHLTGLDVLKRLRESVVHKSLEIVMCTAHNDRATITEAIGNGANPAHVPAH